MFKCKTLNAKTFRRHSSSSHLNDLHESLKWLSSRRKKTHKCCQAKTTTMHKYAIKLDWKKFFDSKPRWWRQILRFNGNKLTHTNQRHNESYAVDTFVWISIDFDRKKHIACILVEIFNDSGASVCWCGYCYCQRGPNTWNCSFSTAINCDKYNNSNVWAVWSIANRLCCQYELFGQLPFVVIISNKQLKSSLFVMLLLALFICSRWHRNHKLPIQNCANAKKLAQNIARNENE